jgi:hypothetical protein
MFVALAAQGFSMYRLRWASPLSSVTTLSSSPTLGFFFLGRPFCLHGAVASLSLWINSFFIPSQRRCCFLLLHPIEAVLLLLLLCTIHAALLLLLLRAVDAALLLLRPRRYFCFFGGAPWQTKVSLRFESMLCIYLFVFSQFSVCDL